MFEECRLEGDFVLSSGRSSKVFYDFDLLKPTEAAVYVEQLLQQVPNDIMRRVNFIASPALGGIIPGFLAAFAAKKSLIMVDKSGKVRGPEFQSGNYLIVDDVITSFGAARSVIKALPGNTCLGIAAYIFRGSYADISANKNFPTFYLARKEQEE